MTADKVMPLAVGLFVLGVLAIVAVFVLFATGHSDLPVWLNVAATLCAPVGLALGVLSSVRRRR
ncbi:hypothetical protein Lesp02_65100 [Lentzea sp. NBRC 105346]|uniref:hypothetical protein n=1 Tax=Lentzea sp. NBRC 105346 TaxID=3032205 RepID=UPI0024A0BCC3|nr:hypothetical protein [Lentzea sp. NBRC 105346]GLZ34323.1 hypothetical protein Lesp02_65100 [Lentzea sp. NBRC 105346]